MMSHRHEGPKPKRPITQHMVEVIIKISRDLIIFALGCVGFIHELLRDGDERTQILILCAAAMGLPFIIRGDEKRQEAKANGNRSQNS